MMLVQHPRLFDGLRVYMHGDFPSNGPSKEQLSDLVTIGGGTVIVREPRSIDDIPSTLPYHCKGHKRVALVVVCAILSHPRVSGYTGVYTKSPTWLLDCVSHFAIDLAA